MRMFVVGVAVAIGLSGPVATRSAAAQAFVSDNVRTFAVLPDGVRFPEGITANPANGDIYVGTFDFGPNPNALLRYDARGRLLGQRNFGAAPLLGLAFGPGDGKVYIANFGTFRIQRVAADLTGPIEDVAVLPGIGAPAPRIVGNPDGSSDTIMFGSSSRPAPNGLAFEAAGHLYVSDSFQGAIFRIASAHACAPCVPSLVVHHERLVTAGFPPFGANGLALSRDGNALFIANTGDQTTRTNEAGALPKG
jgi:sugar lactone lactonase YvrE